MTVCVATMFDDGKTLVLCSDRRIGVTSITAAVPVTVPRYAQSLGAAQRTPGTRWSSRAVGDLEG